MKKDWHELISQPQFKVKEERDVKIPMRDRIRLSADIYRPDSASKFPALLAFEPFGRRHEEMAAYFPPQQRPSRLWDGNLESGDTQYLVSRGYAHVVVDYRGVGDSEGEYYGGLMGVGGSGEKEGKDLYDTIEWIARQPWCDGNVGMVGISILATVQIMAAIEHPPHLKAIFPEGGHYDVYETNYHGGIFWLMMRAAIEGLGGDGFMPIKNPYSLMKKNLTKEEYERAVNERLKDPDIRNFPNCCQMLKYPDNHAIFVDLILNPLDGPWWWNNEPSRNFDKIKIPAHFGAQWGRGWATEGNINAYLGVNGPKKLVLRSPPPMQERPFHEFHDEIIRWYDHWLKNIDTGVMDEPPIKIFVQGINEWRYAQEWPLPGIQWTDFYLRSRHRLLTVPEPFGTADVPPDGFYQAPLTVTNKVLSESYTSPPFTIDTTVIGPCALYLNASIDTDDTNWIVRIKDVDSSGKKVELSTGWLKASLRELDENKSQIGRPVHPHTRSIPVVPGEINEYAIKIYSLANVFKKGHSVELEISSLQDPFDSSLNVLPPDSLHLNSGRATVHKIYRDKDFQSRLVLPIMRGI